MKIMEIFGSNQDEPTNGEISPQSNLEVVKELIIGRGPRLESPNICRHLTSQDGYNLFYVSLNAPLGDLEAFVVEKGGQISYYDCGEFRTVVVNNEIVFDEAPGYVQNDLEDITNSAGLDEPEVEDGGVKEYYKALIGAR